MKSYFHYNISKMTSKRYGTWSGNNPRSDDKLMIKTGTLTATTQHSSTSCNYNSLIIRPQDGEQFLTVTPQPDQSAGRILFQWYTLAPLVLRSPIPSQNTVDPNNLNKPSLIETIHLFTHRASNHYTRGIILENLMQVPLTQEPPTTTKSRLKCILLNCRSASKHTADIADLILTHKPDLLFLTETWLNDSSTPILDILVPPNHDITRLDRPDRPGWGIACIHRNSLSVNRSPSPDLSSCEYLCLDITSNNKPTWSLHSFYRPPGDNLTFIEQFIDIVTTHTGQQNTHIFLADFYLHWNDPNDRAVNRLKTFLLTLTSPKSAIAPLMSKAQPLTWLLPTQRPISLTQSSHAIGLIIIPSPSSWKESVKLHSAQPTRPKISKRNLKNSLTDLSTSASVSLLLPPGRPNGCSSFDTTLL